MCKAGSILVVFLRLSFMRLATVVNDAIPSVIDSKIVTYVVHYWYYSLESEGSEKVKLKRNHASDTR